MKVDLKDTIYFLDQPVTIARKTNRKTMTVKIQVDQPLVVLTHTRVGNAEILKFLNSKKTWIEKNLLRIKEQHALNPKPKFEFLIGI